ncbi:MAG: hypothetical protein LBV52_05610 [Spirochaetaceae bacterium]|jgi:hypothetical protein|nr:hypothetical protein [Spirochaetaceae bacterium]
MRESGKKLLSAIGNVKRARDFRLYMEDGRRLVDLWQCGGAAVLGHKPASLVKALKNTAERGLFAPFPGFYEKRLTKALSHIFKNKVFYFYSCENLCCENLCEKSLEKSLAKNLPPQNTNSIKLWRPFSSFNTDIPFFKALMPCPIAPSIYVADKNMQPLDIPASDILPPVILACTVQAVNNFITNKDRGSAKFQKINDIFLNGGKENFVQEGIYIYAHNKINNDQNNDQWEKLFYHFLKEGFLFPPFLDDPLILPDTLSKGEEDKLCSLLREIV